MQNEVSRPSPTIEAQPSDARPMSSAAVLLSRWRIEDVAFNNLVRAGMRIDLSALEPGTFLELHPCLASTQEALEEACSLPAEGKPVLCLEGVAGALCIEHGEQWVRALTNVPLDRNTEAAERAWMLATAAALLPAPLRQMFNTIRPSQALPSVAHLHKACLVLRTTDHVLTTHGYATGPLWQQLFGSQTSGVSPLDSWLGWRSMVCRQPVAVGYHVLSQARVRKLSVGDIVMPERLFFDVHGRGQVQVGAWQLNVQSTAGPELEVVAMYSNSENPEITEMDHEPFEVDSAQGMPGPDDSVDLSSIPIQLQFELGVLSMSLGQMQTLAAGSIVRLQAPAAPPMVRILAGGQVIGKGDLIDVDGQLGVQITSWAGA